MPDVYDYDKILIHVNYRFTDFRVTLTKWIQDEMYNVSGYSIMSVTNSDGTELPFDVIPEQYRNYLSGYREEIAFWSHIISFAILRFKQLLGMDK